MGWFKRNAESIEAAAALITAMVAILALVGVKWQIDAARQQTMEQGARDLYREHLALSLQNPHFSDPGTCPAFTDDEETAYHAYVTHLIYTAEETIAADPSWWPVMAEALTPHTALICDTLGNDISLTDPVSRMLNKRAVSACADLAKCSE